MSELSEQQITANRENAQLSTGPKSEEGKQISKYNALKHGILSKEILLADEDKESLENLGRQLRDELRPMSEIEHILVDRITANTWRLRRVLAVEKNAMDWQINHQEIEFSFNQEENHDVQQKRKKMIETIANDNTDQILRYETTIERGIYRALHELQRIQATRQGKNPTIPMAIDIDIVENTK